MVLARLDSGVADMVKGEMGASSSAGNSSSGSRGDGLSRSFWLGTAQSGRYVISMGTCLGAVRVLGGHASTDGSVGACDDVGETLLGVEKVKDPELGSDSEGT